MTVTQIDRATTQHDARHIPLRPATTLVTTAVRSNDTQNAERAAAVAALVTAISLLIVGIYVAMTTAMTASPLHGFVLTAGLAGAPFAMAAFVYAVDRLVRIATR